ncbi:MAG: ATP-binding cassette domain-containing protein [Treponema sp.]|nr:ATP-binding cassette domain-containing protein [Treponema sp.]
MSRPRARPQTARVTLESGITTLLKYYSARIIQIGLCKCICTNCNRCRSGERGVTLSGGQKQRVAIARMLAGGAPVMIFDDSLFAVDTETDAKIRAALRGRVSNVATIIISHRISSLMQADKILVLKNGTVEDIGCHAELLERGGSYRRIFEL